MINFYFLTIHCNIHRSLSARNFKVINSPPKACDVLKLLWEIYLCGDIP